MFGNHISKKLSAYYHSELSPQDARRVAEHLLHCQHCRKEYEEIKMGAQLAAQLSLSEAPESLWKELELMLNQAETERAAAPAHHAGAAAPEGTQRKSGATISSLKPLAAFATLLVLIGAGALWVYLRRTPTEDGRTEDPNKPAWAVKRIEGQPKIGERQIGEKGRLSVGEWLVTDDRSRAQISVGEIGEVRVEPNSRIRLVQAREDEHRLAIPRGKMHAFIWAPPRQFYVDTPSAVAVDLGCTYTLEVKDDEQGLLHVTSGWVAFEWEGRESFVPAEAECVTRPRLGPGTPYFRDASARFQDSLAKFDTAKSDETARASALGEILNRSRKKDALTLWHLLRRTNEAERSRVYDRLAKLIPPPKKVTRAGILLGDRAMIDAWWDKLELGDTEWWRMWKGPIPSQTK